MTREEALKAFTAKKLAAVDRIRRDSRLTQAARNIGAELLSRLNARTGEVMHTEQEDLAERLGISTKTVKRAVQALVQAGYFEVRKSWKVNTYRPVLDPVNQGTKCPLTTNDQGTICPPSDPVRGQKGQDQGTFLPDLRGQIVPHLTLEDPLTLPLTEDGGRDGAAPDGAAAPASELPSDIATAIAARIGAKAFESWFTGARLVAEEGDTVTLSSPHKYAATKLATFYDATIVECWRAVRPETRCVRVITSKVVAPDVAAFGGRVAAGSEDARWLVGEGVAIVKERTGWSSSHAQRRIVAYLERCRNDAAGLRQIISDADRQQLVGDDFDENVKRRTKQLMFADQAPLPIKFMGLKRRAS